MTPRSGLGRRALRRLVGFDGRSAGPFVALTLALLLALSLLGLRPRQPRELRRIEAIFAVHAPAP